MIYGWWKKNKKATFVIIIDRKMEGHQALRILQPAGSYFYPDSCPVVLKHLSKYASQRYLIDF